MNIRNKLLALLLAVCLVCGLLPAAALAAEEVPAPAETPVVEVIPAEEGTPAEEETSAEEETPAEDGTLADDADSDGYHDGDVAVIQGILARSSYLSEGADPADPGSWNFVAWTEDAVKRVYELDVSSSGLSGTLDVSALTELGALDCSYTDITALDLSNCPALEILYVEKTGIASLDMTAFPRLSIVGFGAPSAAVNTLKTSLTNVTLNQPEGGEAWMFLNLVQGTADVSASPENGYSLTGFEGLPAGADVDLESGYAAFPVTGDLTLSAVYVRPEPNAEEVAVLLDLLERSGKAAEYDLEDPGSWNFVYWQEIGGEMRVTDLDIYDWTDLTGELDLSAMTELSYLDCSSTGITALDLSGLTKMVELNVCMTGITELDLSAMTELSYLDCSFTGITALDLSGLTKMVELNVCMTGITELDVSGMPELLRLDVSSTGIASLDLSQNPKLETLYINGSKISTLDTTAHEALTEVWFGASGAAQDVLTTDIGTMTLVQSENGSLYVEVDLSTGECGLCFSSEEDCYLKEIKGLPEGAENHNTVITFPWTGGDLTISAQFEKKADPAYNEAELAFIRELLERSGMDEKYDPEDPASWDFVLWEAFDNELRVTELVLYEWAGLTGELAPSVLEKLTWLYCSDTGLTALDVSENTGLVELEVSNAGITALDVTELSELTWLDADNIPITELDVSRNPRLEHLDISGTGLTKLDVTMLPALTELDCDDLAITELDVSKNPRLEDLDVSGTALTKLDVSNNPALVWLDCDNADGITVLDVSKNAMLEDLYVSATGLTKLDVSNNPALVWLDCDNADGITALDVSKNAMLENLYVSGTALTKLDVSHNPALEWLDCAYTGIAELDVSNNPALEGLSCIETGLTALDVTNNPALTYLDVAWTRVSELDISRNPALEALYVECSGIPGVDMTGFEALEYLGFGTSVAEKNVSQVFGATVTLLQTEGGTLYLYIGPEDGILGWELEEGYELVSVSGLPADAVLEEPEDGLPYYDFPWDGSDLTISAVFEKTDDSTGGEGEPGKPDDPTGDEDEDETDEPTGENGGANKSPKTGDDSGLFLWLALLLGCGAGAAGVCLHGGKKKQQ